jgi:hypothetical protein
MFSLSAEIGKSLEPIFGASLFPVSPQTSRTNAVSDAVEKSLVQKTQGNYICVCLVYFWHLFKYGIAVSGRCFTGESAALAPEAAGAGAARLPRNFF